MTQLLFVTLVIVLIPPNNLAQANENVTVDHTKEAVKGRLEVPSIEQCKYYVLFTGAAYCSIKGLESWNCGYCNKTGESVSIHKVLTNSTHNTLGYVTIDKTKKEIVVTFRGSSNIKNVLNNLHAIQEALDGDIKVHTGFLTAANSLYNQVVPSINELLKVNPDVTSLVVTGHSLGAAIASITLYKFQTKKEFANLRYSLYAYGQPRTGNKAFADYFNQQSIVVARVTANNDLIPHLPPAAMGYVHHQNEIFINGISIKICSKKIYEDPDCSNVVNPQKYSFLYHMFYWNVSYSTCALEDPFYHLAQFFQK